jgi:hypothetical protein
VVLSHYDRATGEGRLSFLEKDVRVALSFSKPSPQRPNEEITVTAQPSALFQPQFEFTVSRYLFLCFGLGGFIPVRQGEGRETEQPLSQRKAWTWFPEEPGWYLIEVRAVDEKESASAWTWFRIQADRTADLPTTEADDKGGDHAKR